MERAILFHHASGGVGGICGFFLSDDTEPHIRRNSFPLYLLTTSHSRHAWEQRGKGRSISFFLFRSFFLSAVVAVGGWRPGVCGQKALDTGVLFHLLLLKRARLLFLVRGEWVMDR